jgi:multiple sugar transport system permease protein
MTFHIYNPITHSNPVFVGIKNYVNLLNNMRFWNSMRVSSLFSASAVTIEFFLGLVIAHLLRGARFRRFFRAAFLLPMVVPPVVVGIEWRLLYSETFGVINPFLNIFGIKGPNWLGSPSTALLSIIITDVWMWTPFMIIVLLAGMEEIPREPIEAAQIDGASSWKIFRHVTLPMLRPAIVVALLIRLIDSLKVFDLVFIMTSGGPASTTEVINYYIYLNAFRAFNFGDAATLSVLLFIFVQAISIVLVKFLSRAQGRGGP